MRLTVLGNAGGYLAPLSGGSSYLVESGGVRVLLDCGGGAREALAARGVARVDALVLSHFHHDHVLDFMTIRDAFPEGMPIVVPRGEAGKLQAMADAFAFRAAYAPPGPLLEEAQLEVGPLRLTFAPTRHSAPSMATRIEDDEGTLVYASDSAPCSTLADLARGADWLLMHALLPDVAPGSGHAQRHSTARTAGRLAAEAGAGTLLISHRHHSSADADMLREAAASHPRVELARTGASYLIRPEGGRPSGRPR
ncbi:MAG TPA: MBL fold metallo-hydrolase [Candidatus Thermoplasmatota archaeon]|nr:MBL fold metallo-hydrolase [Candidatus Thermoplasmatota archaeon]